MFFLNKNIIKFPNIYFELPYLIHIKNHFSNAGNKSDTFVISLFNGLINKTRSDLARSITLVETSNQNKKKMADLLLNNVLEHLRNKREQNSVPSLRVGITGPPGTGKSSLIEAFGKYLTTQVGLRVAVLTVDPSSTTTGGSILGDKVRMPKLSVDPHAYIRSSPNKCNLGGVTRTTLETIFVCEAAQFDIILVETVGVGQAEHAVVNMVDCMVLLIPPGSGDEIQGIKKGIAELADIVAVTKYDEQFLTEAIRVKREYLSAIKYIRRKSKFWTPPVILTSSHQNKGIDELWKTLNEYKETMIEKNEFYKKRESQLKLWFWTHFKENLLEILLNKPQIKDTLNRLETEVIEGKMTPGQASDILTKDLNSIFR